MDMTDRELLNLIQGPFPMVEQPYLDLAQQLEITEEDVLARLTELKRQNVLRQISAIFDTRRLGYKTTLVAMAFEPENLHRRRHGNQPPPRRQPQLRPGRLLLQSVVHPGRAAGA